MVKSGQGNKALHTGDEIRTLKEKPGNLSNSFGIYSDDICLTIL